MAILFDLDGTLIDTAPDFFTAYNKLQDKYNFPEKSPVRYDSIRKLVSNGARGLLTQLLSIDITDEIVQEYVNLYQATQFDGCRVFHGLNKLIHYLENNKISWGIVTNKPHRLTSPLVEKIDFSYGPHCIVSGDTVEKAKPSPLPLLHAAKLIDTPPSSCIYVGDASRDIIAAKAAGMLSIAVLYGYIEDHDDPMQWQADYYSKDVQSLNKDIINLLEAEKVG